MSTYETDAALYVNARDKAVESWRLANKQAFRAMNDGVMDAYAARPGEFAQRAELLQRLVAEAAGFPSMAVWLNQREPRRAA